jgi:hypothetical protein
MTSIVRNRGHVAEEELAAFYTAGYGEQNNPICFSKVISNYTNHIANTPVDGAFQNSLKNNQIKNGSQTAIYLAAYPPSVPLFLFGCAAQKRVHSVRLWNRANNTQCKNFCDLFL